MPLQDKPISELLSDLSQHLTSRDAKNAADDYGYLGRAAMKANLHDRAILFFESALILHRVIDNPWGEFLDLQSQGEAFLVQRDKIPAALACFALALQIGRSLDVPEADDVEARYEVILRQIEANVPDQNLRESIGLKAEDIRAEALGSMLDSPSLAVAFFEDQMKIAGLIEDDLGIFSSLGSQSQVLAEAGERSGSIACFLLTRELIPQIPQEHLSDAHEMVEQWRKGIEDALGSSIPNIQTGALEELENARVRAVKSLTDKLMNA